MPTSSKSILRTTLKAGNPPGFFGLFNIYFKLKFITLTKQLVDEDFACR